jgi:putative heme-binding domain-containing protein
VAALDGLQSGILRGGGSLRAEPAIAKALDELGSSPALLASAWKLSRALGLPENAAQRKALVEATQRAQNATRPVESRIEDIQLLGLGTFSSVGAPLLSLLDGKQSSAIQAAALDVLREFNDSAVAKGLVEHWKGLAPPVRPAAVNLLLQRVPFHDVLMTAIETGQIKLGELTLDLEQRRRLLRKSTPEIQARAAKWIGDEEYSNRKTVVEDWLQKIPSTGDAKRGRATFERICAQCHALAGVGHQVGPDLTAVAHRGVEDLLSNILDPNMAINPSYTSYTVETVSGEIELGILASESADAITLLQPEGKKRVVARREIKRLESTGLSLMPEGLEAGMTPADLRDLIAFLQKGH